MDCKVLLSRRCGLFGETEIIVAKQPDSTALTVVFRVRHPELRGLKLSPTAVTARFNHGRIGGFIRMRQRVLLLLA